MPSKALRLAALVLWAVCGAMAKATVNSTDGGYENLLVAIEENVPYHPDIVNNIMVLFRKASQFLLVATRGKFYFKDVMILTPNTWPSSSDAETMWEDPYKEAEVQISDGFTLPGILEPVPLRAVSPNPVQLPTKYITELNGTTTTQYKKPEYHLIHYWATHRYGVLSEGSSSSPGGIDFYCSTYGTAPTRCSELIKFELTPKAGGKCPDVQHCVNVTLTTCDVTFKQPPNRIHWAKGSIMFLPYVEGFGGDNTG
ncbi:hypothetical protein HPB47_003383 [Ixodes persulcatus]|uniref:Uncharacterized protein n=1 Tax=Ixodes persulcatus TaxID=34615 RepID=A0AC60PIH8_IXOPE|nr:hypothetical protein HPB47_003383 [Ixodes persulcatus]